MSKKIITASLLLSLFYILSASAKNEHEPNPYYGVGLCDKAGYKCIKVQKGQTWENLFPDENQRDLVQRVNRSDTYLYAGKTLAIPEHLASTTIYDISPFPKNIKNTGEKLIIVNQFLLAWGAYNEKGVLVKWGPFSSGKDYCPDIHRSCQTVTGIFYVFNKKGKNCKSNIFPVGKGGTIMPFCMFFYKGYALHGSREVYGYRDSHGCVRLFSRDAQWLNENFVDVSTKDGTMGTRVVVQKTVPELTTPHKASNKNKENKEEESNDNE